jgi:hypothetical protein
VTAIQGWRSPKEWRTREGVSFFGAAQAIGFLDQSTVWDARGGIRVAF